MPRTIPIALQDHLDGDATTTCILIRIDPVTPGYPSYGAALLNRDVTYNDGISEITYSAIIGGQSSTMQATIDMAVDNSDLAQLMPEFDFPISEADIAAGVYDFARYTAYLVNYEDLSQGHTVVPNGYGTLGRITIRDDGLSFVEELRGLSQELKQTICARDSLSCRATFGSQPIGSSGSDGDVVEEREYCGIDLDPLWVSATVTSVGPESSRTFTASALVAAEDFYALGMVRWTSGANNGREFEVEENSAAGVISLTFPTGFTIANGDTFDIRQGCNKQARDDERGCKYHWGAEWPMHFRGEPDIPIGDALANATPGSTTSPGGGGQTSEPFNSEAE